MMVTVEDVANKQTISMLTATRRGSMKTMVTMTMNMTMTISIMLMAMLSQHDDGFSEAIATRMLQQCR